MILQAHRDDVRIVISEAKPVLSNDAFMSLGGSDAPLHLNIVDTNVWVLSVSDRSSLIVTESDTSFATEESLSQLVMAITNAIDSTAYDLNAAAFNEVTNITNDYELDSVEFNFTTLEEKTITIHSADGTLILNETTTDADFVWQPSSELGFNGGDNLTVKVSQFSSPGTMNCVLKVKSGTNTLLGNPHVGFIDVNGIRRGFPVTGGSTPRPRVSVVDYGHEISAGNLPGHIHLWAKGERASVAIDARGEDIWRGPTPRIPHPAVAGERMTVKSNDANDTNGGTGINTIRIEYVTGSGICLFEDITLDGGSVNTVATDIAFVNHMFATSVGSNGVAEGNVDIHKLSDDTVVYNLISLGGNMSLTCALRIPDNVTYFINEWHGGITGNKPSDVRLRSTDWNNILYNGDNPVFLFKDVIPMGESTFDRNLTPPIRVPGGTTIKISVWATQSGGKAGGTINGFYE
jgi:hypothetical protein